MDWHLGHYKAQLYHLKLPQLAFIFILKFCPSLNCSLSRDVRWLTPFLLVQSQIVEKRR